MGAIVIHDSDVPCGMPGADAAGNLVFGGDGESVITLVNANKIMLHCVGVDLINDSGRAQHFQGLPCTITIEGMRYNTFDSHAVVTKNGRGSLHCTVNLPYVDPFE